MHLKTVCKRLTALMLAVLMMLTLLPVSVFADDIDSDMTSHADTDIVSPDTSIADADINDFTTDTSENTEESDDTSAVQEPETETEEEGTDDGMSDGVSVDDEQMEDKEDAAGSPEKPSDDTSDEANEDNSEQQDSDTEELPAPVLRSAANPSRFTGDEAVRLGKEGNNIYGIIVQKDGSSSTSITRHWVTVDGMKYTAYCIEASDASTSGRDGGLEPGTDAGLLWILNNVPEDSDEDYAIKQQAIWAYLGQSFTIRNLAAGSRCSLSTDQLRERLTDIVTNAQNASLTGSQELWIAYHLDNRSYYQDMAFTVAEPPPSITPTPVPTPTPTPTPIPITGSIRVMKSDASTGSALAGAVFQLLDAAFAPVGSPITTDASGIAEWMNLPAGDYYVQEIQAPEGYQVDDALYSASIKDLQAVSNAVTFLREKKIDTVQSLGAYLSRTGARMNELRRTVRSKEQRIRDIDALLAADKTIHDLQPVCDEYSAIRWKGAKEHFATSHADELEQYKIAQRLLHKFGLSHPIDRKSLY